MGRVGVSTAPSSRAEASWTGGWLSPVGAVLEQSAGLKEGQAQGQDTARRQVWRWRRRKLAAPITSRPPGRQCAGPSQALPCETSHFAAVETESQTKLTPHRAERLPQSPATSPRTEGGRNLRRTPERVACQTPALPLLGSWRGTPQRAWLRGLCQAGQQNWRTACSSLLPSAGQLETLWSFQQNYLAGASLAFPQARSRPREESLSAER